MEKEKNIRKSTFYILLLLISWVQAHSQITPGSEHPFYFDAVVFDSPDSGMARVDIFSLIPAQTLAFEKSGSVYGAEYQINITAFNQKNEKIAEKLIDGSMADENFFVAQGGTGKYDDYQTIFQMPKGEYNIRVLLIDKSAQKEYTRSRTITVLDFDSYPFSLSGILLVSSIEERNGRFVLTPHVNDNIAELDNGFFIFFEAYNNSGTDSVDFVYEVINSNDDIVSRSKRFRRVTDSAVSRHYLRIEQPDNIRSGIYTLRLTALKPSESNDFNESDYLAVAQRSVKYLRTIGANVLEDIEKAIDQLYYAASGDEIDFIEKAESESEMISRFEEFWAKRDPTPNTSRNEAFDEFYKRIAVANKLFRSYSEGWKTDKGMVFIIFGQPMQQERFTGYGDGRIYERWIYANNREFIFADNSGFGDYRLIRPMTVSEKYRYRK